ncbi:hypothetical protein GCM10009731_03560 [Streptomyces globosus]
MHESVVLTTFHAQQAAAELQVAPPGGDIAANHSQQFHIVMGITYHVTDLALLLLSEASPLL